MYYTLIEENYIYSKQPPTMTVAATEPEQRFSGLYDAGGNKLYSSQKPEPVGFVRLRDVA